MQRVRDACSRLAKFPQLGSRIPEFPDRQYRQFLIEPYRFFIASKAGRYGSWRCGTGDRFRRTLRAYETAALGRLG